MATKKQSTGWQSKWRSGYGTQCAVSKCTNYTGTSQGVSFFHFPKDEQRCAKWIQNIRRADLVGKTPAEMKNYKLCALHFDSSQFKNATKRDGLNWNAIPNVLDVPNPPPSINSKRLSPPRRTQSSLKKQHLCNTNVTGVQIAALSDKPPNEAPSVSGCGLPTRLPTRLPTTPTKEQPRRTGLHGIKMAAYEVKRTECIGLPSGWTKEEVIRKSGLSAGKTDVYYYSPDLKKIRSKPELVREVGPEFDLSCFDFRSGKINQSAIRKSKRLKGSTYDYARGIRHDINLVLPIRQTASIFKQPVTVVRTRPESKTRSDLKHGPQEQPRQLFWEKRLQSLLATDVSEEDARCIDLPKNILPAGPDLTTENLLASIAAALHMNNQPLIGQNATKAALSKNPGVHINTEQPLVQTLAISDDDIKRQELRVVAARKKLELALL